MNCLSALNFQTGVAIAQIPSIPREQLESPTDKDPVLGSTYEVSSPEDLTPSARTTAISTNEIASPMLATPNTPLVVTRSPNRQMTERHQETLAPLPTFFPLPTFESIDNLPQSPVIDRLNERQKITLPTNNRLLGSKPKSKL